jgi:transcriptional regulator GlxA family with amidase domain
VADSNQVRCPTRSRSIGARAGTEARASVAGEDLPRSCRRECATISSVAPDESSPRQITAVLFDGFELLDVFGPLEIFGVLPDQFRLALVGPEAGPVRSAQGPEAIAGDSYRDAPPAALVLVPGGRGTRQLVNEPDFLGWLARWSSGAEFITSVCTGSALLAAAGLLDGYRATSNKRAFAWAREQGPGVEWVPQARWVQDGNRWTSSGVAAGMDMALALVAYLHGDRLAGSVADGIELEWHRDPAWDPFATKNGLLSA